MSYALKGALPAHFRSTQNRWQTVEQLRQGLDMTAHRVHSALSGYIKRGLIQRQEGEPRRYRMKPDALYSRTEDSLDAVTLRFQAKVRGFCRRYGVNAPHEITSKSESALVEWLEMTANP